MNEVYFINPKFTNGEDYYELPLGMAYLISSVKKNTKSNVKVIDLALNKNKINDYKKIISKGSPIICMSVYSYFVDDIINICKEIKEINNKVKIILGGPHITIDGENFISENLNFDYGIKGEGEYSLPNLINAINNNTLDNDISNIEGLIYRYNGKIKSNPYSRIDNLGEIPSVIEGIKTFDLEKIKNITKSRISYIASRGCPFNCIFCSSSSLWGRKYKQVPIDIVIKDIKELSILGFKHIDFRDDFFTVRKDWTYKLAKVLKELNIEWTCQTRLDSVDRKLLQTMYDSGCTIIRFGIESFNDKSLKLLKKGETYEKIIQTLNILDKMDFKEIRLSLMIGIPDETMEDVKHTIDLCKKYSRFKYRFWALTPIVGTELYDKRDEYGVKILNPEYNPTYSNISTRYLTNEEINKILEDLHTDFDHPYPIWEHKEKVEVCKRR